MKKFNTEYRMQNTEYSHSCSERKGFTLMELIIYSSVLIVSVGLISNIVYVTSKANSRVQAEEALNNQLFRLEEIFRQKIEPAKKINSVSFSQLELASNDESKNPTIFSLINDVLYLKEGSGSQLPLNDVDKVKITSLSFSMIAGGGSSISGTNHYAWNDQVGWIDFSHNIQVPPAEGELKGAAHIVSDSSYIFLDCLYTNSCEQINYKISSDSNGNLSGWAWSENYGWISFSSSTDDSIYDYGVKVSTSTGEFDGYAWSENIGWISFNCKTGGEGGTDICLTSDYKVQDLRLQKSAIKVEITLQYNSPKPELAVYKNASFVFNIMTPTE
ncbi:MAG: hypothetical protein WC507_02840 [Candidatus Paceibacterota bacterium]